MKRISLILILAILLSTLGVSAVSAQTPTGGTAEGGTEVVNLGPCGWGDLEGQVKFGKLYAGPDFSINKWLKENPHVTRDQLTTLNPDVPITGGDCRVFILPSM